MMATIDDDAKESPSLLRLLLGHTLGLILVVTSHHTNEQVASTLRGAGDDDASPGALTSLVQNFVSSHDLRDRDLDSDPINELAMLLAAQYIQGGGVAS